MSTIVPRRDALQKQTHHQFVPGFGYIAHGGAPVLPKGSNGTKDCNPPEGTADGTVHLLRPPNGDDPMAFRWIAAERAWGTMRLDRGNRIAWAPDHLMRAGWAYVSPSKAHPAPVAPPAEPIEAPPAPNRVRKPQRGGGLR